MCVRAILVISGTYWFKTFSKRFYIDFSVSVICLLAAILEGGSSAVAPPPNLFIIYRSTSVPKLVLLSKNAQYVSLPAPLQGLGLTYSNSGR